MRPHKHGRLGRRSFPADAVQAFDEAVAPFLIHVADLVHAVFGAVEGHGGGNLDGLEHAVIQIALDACQGMDKILVAHGKTHAPAGHGIALGQGVKFHAHILGALGLQKAGGLIAVKNQIGVCQIMHNPDVVFLGEIHNLLEEFQIRHFGGGVVRIADEKHLGLGPGLTHGGFKVFKKVAARADGHAAHVRACNDGRVLVDGVGRVGCEHHVARLKNSQRKVGQTFLGTQGHDGFAVRVELHAVVARVAITDGFAQVRNTARKRVAVVHRLLCCLNKLVDDGCGRCDVRIAHAEVHDVDILPTQPHFEVSHHRKNIGGEAANPRKLFHV